MVQVHGKGLPNSPVLKYKQQRGVSCLSWRPFNASDLAVGCASGIVLWNIDPSSVLSRPSASSVSVLNPPPGHSPVTSLQWEPNRGKLLLSASAGDSSIIVWNVAQESSTPLRRFGSSGTHLASWGLQNRLLTATTSTVFKIWETKEWSNERWNVLQGKEPAAIEFHSILRLSMRCLLNIDSAQPLAFNAAGKAYLYLKYCSITEVRQIRPYKRVCIRKCSRPHHRSAFFRRFCLTAGFFCNISTFSCPFYTLANENLVR